MQIIDRLRAPCSPPPIGSQNAVLWCIAAALICPELILSLSDWGIWHSPNLRTKIYYHGAYWPGLLHNWRPNYVGQTVLMHLTYGLLHSSFAHMVFNVVTLVSLGLPILRELRRLRFITLYVLAQIGGALTYAAISQDMAPMVGASGALFGLAGAFVISTWLRDRRWPVLLLPIVMLIALNIIMYISLDGLLAWQTHFGGFVCGVCAYLVFRPTAPPNGKTETDP